MLQSKVFSLSLEHLCFKPKIDRDTQISKYTAFRSNPGEMYIDAFAGRILCVSSYLRHTYSSLKSKAK